MSETRNMLKLLLDQIDYTSGACRISELVGAVLTVEILAKAKLVAYAEETCEWTYDDYHDCWETSCKNAWVMTEGGSPLDNEYKFCPACGNKIVAITPEPEPEEPD